MSATDHVTHCTDGQILIVFCSFSSSAAAIKTKETQNKYAGFTFRFMHLVGSFTQSNLNCIQVVHLKLCSFSNLCLISLYNFSLKL